MEELDEFLMRASARIAPEYFLLPIDGSEARYRERVYCYELYHQLRSQWSPDCRYFLNGEADKRAHPYFGNDLRAPKPDFIVHVPGTRDNYAVIEVKPLMPHNRGIRKDLRTLTRFRGFGYQRALYLFYGLSPEQALERVLAAGATREELEAIEIWAHPWPGVHALRAVQAQVL